ncbi:Microcystin-dependent protein [Pseudarcicella hirudinis]|uniref:Microcystin-dependent protein n=1 Tax=Pseudarcicella hirudinis TaxID=1079859 RepID=A0A1I5P7S4_9BACT|nr:tail fiber protein [Pseudarcicella hirudinis]SFP30159.1 Microcystin-dependent protein [Pseudarcicella hirudinis]
MEPYIGEIRLFAGNFAPRDWAFCAGQLLPIAQNTALFSILGTTYGGDGKVTFGLPDLRGRGPVCQGTSTTGTIYDLGEASGVENVTLLSSEIPRHNHLIADKNAASDASTPIGNYPGEIAATVGGDAAVVSEYSTAPNGAILAPTAVSLAGSTLPHSNMQPYLAVNYIIALYGVYPSRN